MKFEQRIAPENITELFENQIFVFGSNRLGIHGKGAAKTAKLKFGAKNGIGEGLYGRSYAIPTKSRPTNQEIDILSLEEIEWHVNKFIEVAKKNPKLVFMVTKIGCGLAQYSPKDIAPLFKNAIDVDNISLPQSFWNELSPFD